MNKTANRPEGLTPLLRNRWSPRLFSERPVARPDLQMLFEAARWTQSCFNDQPWQFLIATKENPEHFARLLDILVPANQTWARQAPVLVVAVARTKFAHNGKPNRWAPYDLGASVMGLTIQAEAMGLKVHQMGGFDAEKARAVFGIPEESEPMSVFAVGYAADPAAMDEEAKAREFAPGQRREVSAFAFENTWGRPLT
jgi:nitroreductase